MDGLSKYYKPLCKGDESLLRQCLRKQHCFGVASCCSFLLPEAGDVWQTRSRHGKERTTAPWINVIHTRGGLCKTGVCGVNCCSSSLYS